MIEWKEEYATGVEEIDEQHRTLFQYINDLEDVINGDKNADYVKIILKFLGEYAETHFGFEEDCMEKRHCPVACQNKIEHQKFMEEFKKFEDQYQRGRQSNELLGDIHKMTHKWLINHICKIDVHLRAYQKMHNN